jgi:hypothetical protein
MRNALRPLHVHVNHSRLFSVRRLTRVRKYANVRTGGRMPQTRLVFYREDDRAVPLLDWLDELSPKVKVKCRLRLERLKQLGHELRRPEADYLRDDIYELRVSLQGRQYRMRLDDGSEEKTDDGRDRNPASPLL